MTVFFETHNYFTINDNVWITARNLSPLALAEWAEKHAVKLDVIQPGKSTQNTFIERFNRTYRTEILDFYLFRMLNEVREITEKWLSEYNCERPHESLNNMTREEYRQHHSCCWYLKKCMELKRIYLHII